MEKLHGIPAGEVTILYPKDRPYSAKSLEILVRERIDRCVGVVNELGVPFDFGVEDLPLLPITLEELIKHGFYNRGEFFLDLLVTRNIIAGDGNIERLPDAWEAYAQNTLLAQQLPEGVIVGSFLKLA